MKKERGGLREWWEGDGETEEDGGAVMEGQGEGLRGTGGVNGREKD